MSDENQEPRESKKLQARIDELERVVKALLKALIALEEEVDEYTLPKGDYLGIKV